MRFELIYCPFCGKEMQADLHPKEEFENPPDNWICINCEKAFNSTILFCPEDLINLIEGDTSTIEDFSKVKEYYSERV